MNTTSDLTGQVALITGAAHRIGAEIARTLHAQGMNIALHYRNSKTPAQALAAALNAQRANSVVTHQADLLATDDLPRLVDAALAPWGRLDALINNASSFFPTPLGEVTEAHWADLMGSNLKAPFFLTQAAMPHLRRTNGCVVNIVDIHAHNPLKNYPVYSIAKAGLAMLTKTLARELGPQIRVNGVAPGAILWPEQAMSDDDKAAIIDRIALKRSGEPADIANAVLFMIRDAGYVSGHILNVDGGRALSQ